MKNIRKRVFAAVLAAVLLFTMPGMASVAVAEEAQTEDISESATVQAEDDAGDTETDDKEPAEEETVPAQKEDTEECICGTLCTEDSINGDCPVCGAEDADLSRCKGEKKENNSDKDSEYEEADIDTDTEECICGTLCTEDSINETCPVCGAEDADLSCCKGEKTEVPKKAEEKIITAWEWIDPEGYLTDGMLALPGAGRGNPAFLADVTALLPEKIRAEVDAADVTKDGEETEESSEKLPKAGETDITLTGWKCADYPEDGACEGAYTFTASLPEGYVLAEDADALKVKVELGGAKMLAGEVSADYQEASWNGSAVTYSNKTAENCTPVTDSTDAVTWDAEWYVVSGNVTIEKPITVSGNINLILSDGCELNAEQGIVVTGSNSLTIYAQAGGSGTLNATGVYNGTFDAYGNAASAGIGGGTAESDVDSGAITIHGGIIHATGGNSGDADRGSSAAGIGGGVSPDKAGGSGAIVIYGGTITADSGQGYTTGAGIGGGAGSTLTGGAGSHITIYGGDVTATSSAWWASGAGIGGGAGSTSGGAGSDITIYGGNVTATSSTVIVASGAGIGGGAGSTGGAGSDIKIYGGNVTATSSGESASGAGIGGGAGNSGNGGNGSNIEIYGGIVKVTGGSMGAGIGGGGTAYGNISGNGSGITISGGEVTSIGGRFAAGIGGGGGYGSSITSGTGTDISITGGIVDAKGGAGNNSGNYAGHPIGSGGNASDPADVTKTGGIIFENGVGAVYGTVVLDENYDVPAGYSLTFADGGQFDGNYAFYKDGSPVEMAVVKESGVTGPATVQACSHPGVKASSNGDGTHSLSCPYCGHTGAAEGCTYGTAQQYDETRHTRTCTVCGYEDLEAHKFASSSGTENGSIIFYKECLKCNYKGCVGTARLTIPSNLVYGQTAGKTISVEAEFPYDSITMELDWDGNAVNNTSIELPAVMSIGMHTVYISIVAEGLTNESNVAFTVGKAPLTITASDQTITYGGSITQGTDNVTADGLCNGDSLDSITLTASTANVPGGKITPSAAGMKNSGGEDVTGNYEITYKEGSLTINKADAEITVGTDSYNKTFGDPAFILDAADDNPEAVVQYEVTDGSDVVTVSEDGMVVIQNAGVAVITVSLPESGSYHAAESKTITVTVAQKEADTVRELNRNYLYSAENADTIDLAALLPADCGNAVYGKPQTSGAVAYSGQPAVDADGKLTYTLQSGSADTEGTITVTVRTRNYTDFSFAVKVKLTDKMTVRQKAGKEVALKNSTLTYGEALSKLKFKSAVFVDDAGKTVKGTLAWKDAEAIPDAGTASAVWVFTPSAGQYAPVEGLAAITVNRAVPVVSAVPTVAERIYNPSLALKDIALSGGAVTGVGGTPLEGVWGWRYVNVAPTVDNGGYEAVFTPEDAVNYEIVAGTVTVTVAKAVPYIDAAPTADGITYGDTLDRSGLSAGTVLHGDGAGRSGSGAGSTVPVAGTFTWEEPFAKPVAADSDRTEYTVVFKPSDTVNYTTAAAKITLAVDKAQYAPGMPDGAMDVPEVIKTAGGVSLPENWQWREVDRDKLLEAGKTVFVVAVYTGADKGNYETEAVTVAVTGVSVPDGLWISGLTPSVSYTGSAVKPTVKVYHENTLLREKTDYTISYKNNTKAGDAQINVTGKGSYKGKATAMFTIEAVDLGTNPGVSAAIATAVETGKNLKPAVTVTWNGKKLKEKTDYTLSYEANIKTTSAEGYDVTITGKGNYTGVIVEKFHVAPKGTPLLSKATVKGLAKSYPYRENRIPEGLETALENMTVKVGKTTLAKEDYTVRLENVSAVGTGTVVIDAAPGSPYAGQKRVTFNVTGASLQKGSIIGLEKTYAYTGSPVEPEIKVYSGKKGTGEQIPPGSYTVSYSSSVGNGKAKVTVTGIAAKGYSGSLSATYTIGKLNIAADEITVEMPGSIEYAKGGAKPQPVVTHTRDGKADILREGVDYTLKYSNNTSVGGTKKPTVKITGTGNYCGTVIKEYEITGQDIGRLTITTTDKAYNSKKKGNYYYSAPKEYDLNGKLLKSGTDYTVRYLDASTEQEIGKNDAVAQGAVIRATVTGKGSYQGTLSATYRVLAAGDVKDISKAKNDKIANQPYTGAGIRPGIKLYTMTGKTRTDLNGDADYEIIGFYNNINKGTATVLIRGTGAYSGVKSITFKIVAVDNGSIWRGAF